MTRSDPVQMFCLCRDLALRSPPLSDDEQAEYRAAVAREDAKADRRRETSPQLQLPEVAR